MRPRHFQVQALHRITVINFNVDDIFQWWWYHRVGNKMVNPKSTEFANFWLDHLIPDFVRSKFCQTFVDQVICFRRRAKEFRKENQRKLEKEPVNRSLRQYDTNKIKTKKFFSARMVPQTATIMAPPLHIVLDHLISNSMVTFFSSDEGLLMNWSLLVNLKMVFKFSAVFNFTQSLNTNCKTWWVLKTCS